MTTINNSELIEKVGGIEKAREIAFDPLHPQMTHVSNDGRHWVNEAFAHIPEIQCQIESMIRIDDLRTAIAKHDSPEFKVGDLVVLSQSHSQNRVLKIQMFHEDFIRAFVRDSIKYSFGHKINFRHATPSEIKAGHRIDLKQCQHGYDIACLICGFGNENGVRVWRKKIESDEVTDIRNHVSPSTIIKDLEVERHG